MKRCIWPNHVGCGMWAGIYMDFSGQRVILTKEMDEKIFVILIIQRILCPKITHTQILTVNFFLINIILLILFLGKKKKEKQMKFIPNN